jgi:hypothetical protein
MPLENGLGRKIDNKIDSKLRYEISLLMFRIFMLIKAKYFIQAYLLL